MLLEARRLVERATRWLLRHRRRPLDIAATVERLRGRRASSLAAALPEILVDADRAGVGRARRRRSCEAGVAGRARPARRELGALFAALDIVEVASATGAPIDDVAALHFRLGARLHLHWLRDRIAELPRDDRWQAMARAALRDDLYRCTAS